MSSTAKPNERTSFSGFRRGCDALKSACFRQPPFGSATTKEIFQALLEEVTVRYDCRAAAAWSLDPVNRKLALVVAKGINLRKLCLSCLESLSGRTVARMRITRFPDLTAFRSDQHSFQHPHLISELGFKSMVSVPVLNTADPNQVLYVVNFFPASDVLLGEETDYVLENWAECAAGQIETSLADRCSRFANRVDIELGRIKRRTSERFCKSIARLVYQALECDYVEVFLETVDKKELKLVGNHPNREPGELIAAEFVTNCWSSNRERLILDTEKDPDVREAEKMTAAVVPLQDLSGKARGIIACVNRYRSVRQEVTRPFTYDDVAIVEAIGRAFSPRVEILQAEQRRVESLNRLAHELRVPVVAFRAALERVDNECRVGGYRFKFNHFEEMETYCEVMNRLLKELDIQRRGPHGIPLNPQPTFLLRSIVAPACRFMEPLLTKKGLSTKNVHYSGLENFPDLYVDPGLMTQVVFNLLDNGIKYFRGKPDEFDLEIVARRTTSDYELVFRDQGIGVPDGYETAIFELGVRGPNAEQYDVTGEGIGLWMAREIVRRHDGDLCLVKNSDPTEFVLRLPRYLDVGPPRKNVGSED